MTRTDRKLVERKVLGELLADKYSYKSMPAVPREKRRETARLETRAITKAMIAAKEANDAKAAAESSGATAELIHAGVRE
jgi:hypothetical protein